MYLAVPHLRRQLLTLRSINKKYLCLSAGSADCEQRVLAGIILGGADCEQRVREHDERGPDCAAREAHEVGARVPRRQRPWWSSPDR